MIITLVLAAAALQSPEETPKFGAFVEQIPLGNDLEWVSFAPDGKPWLPPADFGSRVRALAFAPDGRRFSTAVEDDRLRVDAPAAATSFVGARGRELGQLRRPGGLAFDARGSGRILVADTLNHRVAAFALDGKPLAVFGRLGADDGQLNHPLDVGVDAGGAVFVADAGNDRIVKFDADGKFVKAFGGRGSYPGLFRHPTGLDVHGQRVYVADRDNHRIQVFDLEGEFVYEWGVSALQPREGNGKLHDPSDVAVSPSGDRVAVIEPMEDRIQIFGPAREDTLMTSPEGDSGVHFGGFPSVRRDVFAVANPMGPSVSIFDLTIGTPVEITKFGRPGNGPGRMLRPVSVLLDEKCERVFVADSYAYTISSYRIDRKPDEVLRFDPFLARFERGVDLKAGSAVSARWPIEPGGMTLTKDGEILVADSANQRVVVFDRELVALRAIDKDIQKSPCGVARDPQTETLFVSGPPAAAADPNPAISGATAPAKTLYYCPNAIGIAINSARMGWTTDSTGQLVRWDTRAFGRTGPVGTIIGRAGLGRSEFWRPEGVAIDEHDRVFVVDTGNHRFQIIDREGKYVDMFGARFYTEAARNPPPGVRPANAWDGAKSVTTNGRSWRVLWKPKVGAIVRGTPLALDVWVFEPTEPAIPERHVDLRLDAWMPEHLHGMTRLPTVARRDDGGFTIDGVLLHMSGFWELDFDVTAKGVTERATTRVDLP
jgi:DNA-binding beta-propeller fold protein YncE